MLLCWMLIYFIKEFGKVQSKSGSEAAACPTKLVLTALRTPQYLTSPNYPAHYGLLQRRLACSWVLQASTEYTDVVIELQVLNSSLEYSYACVRDCVSVLDGNQDFHRPLSTWCGTTWPKATITTTGDSAFVSFSTNYVKNNYAGFILAYWVVKKPVFLVTPHQWGPSNYVLMFIGLVLLIGGPSWVFTLYFVRELRPQKQHIRQPEKIK
ncbi:neuropilin-1-like [Mya arenaria]|uniref:neuropilin-1-like n=1 Tax=Mya arenaria TaxID=6604 RepID=UPI0022E5214B|nr:neuropilin-1-like [Mya arenaria]